MNIYEYLQTSMNIYESLSVHIYKHLEPSEPTYYAWPVLPDGAVAADGVPPHARGRVDDDLSADMCIGICVGMRKQV